MDHNYPEQPPRGDCSRDPESEDHVEPVEALIEARADDDICVARVIESTPALAWVVEMIDLGGDGRLTRGFPADVRVSGLPPLWGSAIVVLRVDGGGGAVR